MASARVRGNFEGHSVVVRIQCIFCFHGVVVCVCVIFCFYGVVVRIRVILGGVGDKLRREFYNETLRRRILRGTFR